MAEIKSTMEMVLERAAKMAAAAEEGGEDLSRMGMRMAAGFLNGEGKNLAEDLQQHPKDQQATIRAGMAETLLRNIVLPRDTSLAESGTKALQGLLDLGRSVRDMQPLCAEIQQLLGQYNQHKDQLKQQLDTAIRTQMEQKMGQRGKSSGQMAMNPAMHPQYKEELARILSDLNTQYNQALDQRKAMVRQLLEA
jgi:hypothetical protein